MSEAFIIDAVRTPCGGGKPGKGALSGMHPQHLAATVLKALQERNDFKTADVDDVIWGTSAQKGMQGGDMGRLEVSAPLVSSRSYCGSPSSGLPVPRLGRPLPSKFKSMLNMAPISAS
ncbi:hypothetical protein [uncultured Zhongshania sp.]|uniref:thiolase family protein n=1 Tax=uncultured Zhongshania sp. TaxID=1642288 RepID=UPI0030D6FB38